MFVDTTGRDTSWRIEAWGRAALAMAAPGERRPNGRQHEADSTDGLLCCTFHIVGSAHYELRMPGGTYMRLAPGQLVLAAPQAQYSIAAAGNAPLLALKETDLLSGALRVTACAIQRLGLHPADCSLRLIGDGLRPAALVRTFELARLLFDEANDPAGSLDVCTSMAEALLALFLREAPQEARAVTAVAASRVQLRIDRLVQALEREPNRAWSLELMAHTCLMSRSSLLAHFQRRFGLSPHAYLGELRMRSAMKLLAEGGLSTQAISERIGYASEAAFAKAFKRHAGVGPGEFRRRAEH